MGKMEKIPRSIKIVSDGSNAGTTITDAATGEKIEALHRGLTYISWETNNDTMLPEVTLRVIFAEVELTGDIKTVMTPVELENADDYRP